MQIDKYPIVIGETSMVFEFLSVGNRGSIPKLVIYSTTHLHNFYNLGFGDKDQTTGEIDDEVITNNGDSEKVLQLLPLRFIFLWTNFLMLWFLLKAAVRQGHDFTELGSQITLLKYRKTLKFLD